MITAKETRQLESEEYSYLIASNSCQSILKELESNIKKSIKIGEKTADTTLDDSVLHLREPLKQYLAERGFKVFCYEKQCYQGSSALIKTIKIVIEW